MKEYISYILNLVWVIKWGPLIMCSVTLKHTQVVSINLHSRLLLSCIWLTPLECVLVSMNAEPSVPIAMLSWRHQMKTFSTLLALCEGNPTVTSGFPSQRSVTWSLDVFFDLCLNKQLSKQFRCWWFWDAITLNVMSSCYVTIGVCL